MRIIISDSGCLSDLRKAALLAAFFWLPYEILIPNTLFEDELLSFSAEEKCNLVNAGLKVVDLLGPQVSRARDLVRAQPRLSLHDALGFALAEIHPGCSMLTSDSALRLLAERHRIEVHGVLWVCDQLFERSLSTAEQLYAALSILTVDPAVRIPKRELGAHIRRYQCER
jgi:hypothetical protein